MNRPLILTVVLAASSLAPADERLGDATEPHPDAPLEVRQLEFLIGRFEIHTTFTSPDGSQRHTEAELEGRYILSGYGVQIVEVHTPDQTAFPEVDSTFVTTTVFNYDTDNDRWSGASVNSLGNRKVVDGTMTDGRLVLTQHGKLFRGREGQNRLTFHNIGADRFEFQLDYYDAATETWTNGSYRYVASRVPMSDGTP